uniref:Uncharacterized protein n=1 Tax=Pseudomonas phage Cygsa01 TaxID=3138529 RepID=A0AAU6W492_9VIRU
MIEEPMDEYHLQRLAEMVKYGEGAMEIKDLASVTPPGGQPPYTPYGCVIAEDGTTYALRHYALHGAVIAMLYPDLAEAHGVPLPEFPLDGIPKLAYQGFGLIVDRSLPIIQVTGGMMGKPAVRWEQKPSAVQIESFRIFCLANDLGMHDKLRSDHGKTDEEGEISIRKLLTVLAEYETVDHEKLAKETTLVIPS